MIFGQNVFLLFKEAKEMDEETFNLKLSDVLDYQDIKYFLQFVGRSINVTYLNKIPISGVLGL